MIANKCKHRMSVFDLNSEQNFVTCKHPECEHFCSLVNSYVCGKCPHRVIGDDYQQIEKSIEPRKQEACLHIFTTSCSQCRNYDDELHNCSLLHNSRTIQENIQNSELRCPRGLW